MGQVAYLDTRCSGIKPPESECIQEPGLALGVVVTNLATRSSDSKDGGEPACAHRSPIVPEADSMRDAALDVR